MAVTTRAVAGTTNKLDIWFLGKLVMIFFRIGHFDACKSGNLSHGLFVQHKFSVHPRTCCGVRFLIVFARE